MLNSRKILTFIWCAIMISALVSIDTLISNIGHSVSSVDDVSCDIIYARHLENNSYNLSSLVLVNVSCDKSRSCNYSIFLNSS